MGLHSLSACNFARIRSSFIWVTLVVNWMSYASVPGFDCSNFETWYSFSSRNTVVPPWFRACQRRDSWVRPKIKKLHPGEQEEIAVAMEESSAVDMWGFVVFVSTAA